MFSNIDTIVELQNIVIFGIGTLFLYLVVPVALFANEVRLAKRSDDTSGTAAIFNSITQAFFFIIAWSVFVTIIVFMVVKIGEKNDKDKNPATAIDRYWRGDWIKVPDTGGPNTPKGLEILNNFTSSSEVKKDQAKLMILIITGAKALEMLLLGVLMALTLKLSMSLPLLKMRRADHYKMTTGVDIGTMMSLFMTGILGWVIFIGILNFESILLTSLVKAGKATTSTTGPFGSPDIDLLKGLKDLLISGMNRIKS